jgi:hypothetical protein
MARLKAQGLTPGVSDYIVPVAAGRQVAAGEYHGLWIELKRTKGGRVSPEQELFQERMSLLGYRAAVARGWEEARITIMGYLRGTGDVVLEPANGIAESPPWWPR